MPALPILRSLPWSIRKQELSPCWTAQKKIAALVRLVPRLRLVGTCWDFKSHPEVVQPLFSKRPSMSKLSIIYCCPKCFKMRHLRTLEDQGEIDIIAIGRRSRRLIWSSKVIKGHQRSSKVIKGHQINGRYLHFRILEFPLIKGHQRSSKVINICNVYEWSMTSLWVSKNRKDKVLRSAAFRRQPEVLKLIGLSCVSPVSNNAILWFLDRQCTATEKLPALK